MMKTFGFVIICVFILQAILSFPNASSENNRVEWIEGFTINGSCGSDNVRTHFQVNRTVVEIIVNLSWVTEEGYANLDMWVEDTEGYVVNASSSTQIPELMRVRAFPNRGKWTFVVTPTFCGSTGGASYTANITLRNIVLPELEVSAKEIEAGENVTLSISTACENVSQYYYDFGDGANSGWVKNSSFSRTYKTSGEYYPKARVQYSDGTESDWVEAGKILVRGGERKFDLFFMAQVLLIILVVIIILTFLIIKK